MRTSVTICVAALAVTSAPAGRAAPPSEGPLGRRCGYVAYRGEDGEVAGTVDGGPMAGHGTLVCTLVRDIGRHDNPAVVWRFEQPSVEGVAVLPPRLAGWQAEEHEDDFVCTSWRYPDGTTIYWRGAVQRSWPLEDEPGHWTTDPASECVDRTDWDAGPLLDVDERLCPVLRTRHSGPFHPPHPYRAYVDDDGDVYLDDDGDGRIQGDEVWWDCPPYQWVDPARDPLQ